jgi:hypothetical protein
MGRSKGWPIIFNQLLLAEENVAMVKCIITHRPNSLT